MRRLRLNLLIAAIVAASVALAADITLTLTQQSQTGAATGGMVTIQHGTNTPWEVWHNNITGNYELYACQGAYSSAGVFGCTTATTCLTCGKDLSLVGYSVAGGNSYGAPWFDPTGAYLSFEVSANVNAASCNSPGNGVGCDLAVLNFSNGVLSNPNGACNTPTTCNSPVQVNLTQISSNTHGVLYGRLDGNTAGATGGHIWLSYMVNAGSTGACSIGEWEMREFAYTISGGNVIFGAENTNISTASLAAFPCNYIEASGWYDAATDSFTFQVAPGTTAGTVNNNFWNQNYDAIGPTNSGSPTVTTLLQTKSNGTALDWWEHGIADTTGTYAIISGSYGTPNYNPSELTFISVALEDFRFQINHSGCVSGNTPVCTGLALDVSRKVQLTYFNTPGSPDHSLACASVTCSSGSVQISGGYKDMGEVGGYVRLVKRLTVGPIMSATIANDSRVF